MQRLFFSVILLTFLLSCASSKDTRQPSDIQPVRGTAIKVDNPTGYNVYFIEKNQKINKRSNGTVTLLIEDATLTGGFDIWYEIPLSDTVPLFVKGDHRTIREVQSSLAIREPVITENYGTFIAINNLADNAITFHTGNSVEPLWEQIGTPSTGAKVARTDKREFYKTGIFGISGNYSLNNYYIRDSRKNTPLILPVTVKMNYLYAFDYGANGVEFADARPLHRVGESGWVKPVPVTAKSASTPLLALDGTIQLFAPVSNGVMRYAYDSGGNKKAEVKNGDNFQIASAIQAGNGYFIAGYEKKGDRFFPVARIHNADGTMRRLLQPPNRPEYYSAFYKTAAQKDDTWLVAGGAKAIDDHDSFAYVRLARDNGSALAVSWELGKKEFNDVLKITDQSPLIIARCGEIKCSVYDSDRNRWLLSGENIEYDSLFSPITGSYLAVIGNDGKIQKIDTSFTGISFYKILPDKEGNYYLLGEEQKGNDTLAVIIKYSSDGRKLMQNIAAPQSHSWYQDAVLDIENGQIVLGGTMQAADEDGNRGIPFIEGLSVEKLERLWQTPLNDSAFGKASLVTAVVPAPDYGFALTLSGIDDGYIDRPYLIARVNARGKLLK